MTSLKKSENARQSAAARRTISFLDGKTEQERQAEAERIRNNADLAEHERAPAKSIEEESDKYRAQAFVGQEWVTKHFNDPDATSNQYRTTLAKGFLYLEKQGMVCAGKDKGPAYGYAGIMFPEEDAPAIARVVVDAAKAYIAKQKEKKNVS